MGKTAFVFPGQGAQSVGMARDVFEQHEGARKKLEQADDVLGFSLTKLMFDGPEDELKHTSNTQPALLAASVALYEVYKELGVQPDYVAGHSLGEYSALVISGVLEYEAALKLVRSRGLFMEEAVPAGRGAMAAALGADTAKLEKLCEDVLNEFGTVELANFNCPGQVVVSGEVDAVRALSERAGEAGARKVVSLEVSGPFHSSLMRPAAEKLESELADVRLEPGICPLIANVTARPVEQPEEIRSLLVRQVYSPVLWQQSVEYMLEQGVDTFVEIGSGKVLSGLIKKVNRKVKIVTLNSLESIESIR